MSRKNVVLLMALSSCLVAAAAGAGSDREHPRTRLDQDKEGPVIYIADDKLMRQFEQSVDLPAFAADGVPYSERLFAQIGKRTYLIQRGWDLQGNCRSWAAELTALTSASGQEDTAVTTHTCTGAPCSSCEFLKKYSMITGCKCNSDGKCNHTITEAN